MPSILFWELFPPDICQNEYSGKFVFSPLQLIRHAANTSNFKLQKISFNFAVKIIWIENSKFQDYFRYLHILGLEIWPVFDFISVLVYLPSLFPSFDWIVCLGWYLHTESLSHFTHWLAAGMPSLELVKQAEGKNVETFLLTAKKSENSGAAANSSFSW